MGKRYQIPQCASPVPFLPMTMEEVRQRGWDALDILIITGDAYCDHPSFGAALIGRALESEGWRVGILPQPGWQSSESFKVMGRPLLFCGITAGNLDSMLAHYTAARHKRKRDVFSEGGMTGRRPNLATIVYAQRAREAFPGLPIILGGIEASMRRAVHYDYWQDRIRPSVLLDSKADLLIYGMGEEAVCEAAKRLASDKVNLKGIRGTAYLLGEKESSPRAYAKHTLLPSWEECQQDRRRLLDLTKGIEAEQNPFCAKRLVQYHGKRALVIEPPAFPLHGTRLDRTYELPFTRMPHPSYSKPIPGFSTIKDSVTVVRGCPGGCSFCSLGFHQGRFLSSRSEDSVIREIRQITAMQGFSGTISDLGGPTANLYGCKNGQSDACKGCRRPSCLFPSLCRNFIIDEEHAIALYRNARGVKGVRHLFISSGVRMDVALKTPSYTQELIRHHVSGHLKVAPEHLNETVLLRMRKPPAITFYKFLEIFTKESRNAGKEQYLVPYFISSFPGCSESAMQEVEGFLKGSGWRLQQVQDFIPLPMTPAAAMYYTGLDYDTGEPIYVARGLAQRRRQIEYLK